MTTNDTALIYHTNYIRNSRAVGVLWGIFTICYAIIAVVVVIQPFWIGDSTETPAVGHFGLYSYCVGYGISGDVKCVEDFDFGNIPSGYWQAATIFAGVSTLLILTSIICMLLFLFVNTARVFKICAWQQVISALLLLVCILLYPAGWDDSNTEVHRLCSSDVYDIGKCQIRWAYILAIIGVFDAAILGTLAFILASRQDKLLPEHLYHPEMHGHKGSYASPGSSLGRQSKQSFNLHPVPAGENRIDDDVSSRHSKQNGSIGKRSNAGSSIGRRSTHSIALGPDGDVGSNESLSRRSVGSNKSNVSSKELTTADIAL
ncbi:LHFPL tetraspan subfamily member 5 protein-like [Saccoglossus kowalevskii]|uniref:Lipoma HMGIC fusion partner-like 3 protein-like n=1 Tax=Saccoglossus kowalevskii TaxID=10224 RepID=A0ABM0GYL5_SACKO|nr:PREDICTED: lipoma HMGIC fusion partner-like 3 protein-like [Saccoglossus kowalevskii]